jgi:hypothetical protein
VLGQIVPEDHLQSIGQHFADGRRARGPRPGGVAVLPAEQLAGTVLADQIDRLRIVMRWHRMGCDAG